MNAGNLRVLREEPRFRTLLAAGFISGVGDWFNQVAALSLLLRLTGSGLAVGVSLALYNFPRLLFGPLGGVVADRLPRKVTLIVTDCVSAGVALSFLFVTRADQIWALYLGTLLLTLMATAHAPARAAAVPTLVRSDNLLAANGLDGTASGAVLIVGAALGGVASAALGPQFAFTLNALSFLLSALLALTIHFPSTVASERANAAASRRWGVWRVYAEFLAVWPVVRASRIAQVILLLATLWPVGGGVINVLVSVYGAVVFHAGSAGVGVLYGAIGVGLLLGGIVTPLFRRRVREALLAGFLLEGACHALVSRAPSLALAAGALTLATLGAGVGNACASYLVMRAVPNAFLGRFNALLATLSSVTFGVSVLVAGALLASVAPRLLGLLAGLLIVAMGLACALPLLRAPLPEASEALASQKASPEQSVATVG